MKLKDPICGMPGTIPKYGYKFCSQHCIRQFELQRGIPESDEETSKWPVYVLIAALLIGAIIGSWKQGFMRPFMGVVMIGLAGLKLLDLKGFASAYQMYDVITKFFTPYAYAYPFIELLIGILLLAGLWTKAVASILIFFMIEGLISVGIELHKGRKIKCACMGTKINVPLTTLTLIENSIMIFMAVMIIFWIA